MVVLGHTAHFLIADISRVPDPGWLLQMLYFFTSLGHFAVMVFFVISGYLVGGLTLDKWLSREPDITEYAISRFSRIYTVLIPALALGGLIDYAGTLWLSDAGLYTNVGMYPIGSLDHVGMRLDLLTFVGNILMLEGSLVTSLGSNGPLWSLAYEWWYYCIFCFVAAGLMSRGWPRYALLLCIVPLPFVLPKELFLWMPIWILGIALFRLRNRVPRVLTPRMGLALFAVTVVIAFLWMQRAHQAGPEPILLTFARDCLVGLGFSCVLLSFVRAPRPLRFAAFHQWAAGFSYSMYLFHFPVLLAVVAAANQYLGWGVLAQPTPAVIGRVAAVVILLYLIGYGFSHFTERHTASVRAVLRNRAARVASLLQSSSRPRPSES